MKANLNIFLKNKVFITYQVIKIDIGDKFIQFQNVRT